MTTTDKPNFITVKFDEIRKDPTHRLDPKYWIRKRRKNEENLILAKKLAKHLILHRLWNGLSQNKIALDLNVSHQQYQKFESCTNDILYIQVAKIFKNRGWSTEILGSNPYEVLNEWIKRDYTRQDEQGNTIEYSSEHIPKPDKLTKIENAWKLLDLKAEKNYYKK